MVLFHPNATDGHVRTLFCACIVISIAAIICSSFVSMAHYRQALFSMTYFSSLVFFCGVCIAHFAAPAKYPDRGINSARWKYIFHSTVCGLRDHSPLYVNLYVLGYEYCPCHYPPLHFYYCQIDKILTEEWVMTYIPAVSWSVFLLFCYTI